MFNHHLWGERASYKQHLPISTVKTLLSWLISIYQPDAPQHKVGRSHAQSTFTSHGELLTIVLQKETDMKMQSELISGREY